MFLIFRYVLNKYLKFVSGTLFLCVFLFVLFDFIHKTTGYFAKYNPTTTQIIYMYLLQTPTFLQQAIPIASLLASVIAMVLLSRSNEITAMRAAGMGPFQISMPIAFGGGLLSIFAFVIGEWVVPRTAASYYYLTEVKIEGAKIDQVPREGHWLREQNRFIYFERYDVFQKKIVGLKLLDFYPTFRPMRSTYCQEGSHNMGASSEWEMINCKFVDVKNNGMIEHINRADKMKVLLPFEPKQMKYDKRKSNEMSIQELFAIVNKGEHSGVDVIDYKVDLHIKISFAFAALIIALIGIKFAYKSERSVETATSVLLAFGVGISYWFILNTARAFGRRGSLDPFIAAWIPNALILFFVCFEIWRLRKTQ